MLSSAGVGQEHGDRSLCGTEWQGLLKADGGARILQQTLHNSILHTKLKVTAAHCWRNLVCGAPEVTVAVRKLGPKSIILNQLPLLWA